jgi:hypothetical protein
MTGKHATGAQSESARVCGAGGWSRGRTQSGHRCPVGGKLATVARFQQLVGAGPRRQAVPTMRIFETDGAPLPTPLCTPSQRMARWIAGVWHTPNEVGNCFDQAPRRCSPKGPTAKIQAPSNKNPDSLQAACPLFDNVSDDSTSGRRRHDTFSLSCVRTRSRLRARLSVPIATARA